MPDGPRRSGNQRRRLAGGGRRLRAARIVARQRCGRGPAAPAGVQVTSLADGIWYPIWDSGVKLDHSVRTPAQARRMANDDVKVMLGLLDARTIAGDESLLAGLRTSALADWRGRAASRLDELADMMRMRRERFGELAHLQEPDLKESIGGCATSSSCGRLRPPGWPTCRARS